MIDLLTDVTEHLGNAPTASAVSRLKEIHRAALEASSAPRHAIQVLQDKLAEADREARSTALQRQSLLESLGDRRHQIADLQMKLSRAEAEHREQIYRADLQVARLGESVEELRSEKEELERTISHLEEQLVAVQGLHAEAEARCEALERQLEKGERPGAVEVAEDRDSRRNLRFEEVGILVVDESAAGAKSVEAILAPLAQKLSVVTSAGAALEALSRNRDFAAILISVGHESGVELAAFVSDVKRGESGDIPVIFLTDHVSTELSFRAYAAGASDVIALPVDPWVLRAKVSLFIELYWKTVLSHEASALIHLLSAESEGGAGR